MSFRSSAFTAASFALLSIAAGTAVWWLVWYKPPETVRPAAAEPPASMPRVLKEDQINVLTLSSDAITRLALRTESLERGPVTRFRIYGGEITLPPGQAILVASPLSGTLLAVPGSLLQTGAAVRKGQQVLRLAPLLSPESRANLTTTKVEADGQLKSAETQRNAARIALDRAKRVFQSEAGSRRALDEAQAQFDLAEKAVEAAGARSIMLEKVLAEIDKGVAAPIGIECPADGLVRNIMAQAGQIVPAGAGLFEVVNLTRVWVRVPVFTGDLAEVRQEAEVAVGVLGARPEKWTLNGRSVKAVPAANPAAGTVDLYFALDNTTAEFSPGQRVAVRLALQGLQDALTISWSAVVYDIHGGTWVYVQTGDRTFERQRVVVKSLAGDRAVLAGGPARGSKIVVAGAAELFGTETGFTK